MPLRTLLFVTAALLAGASLPAQRATAEFDHQKRTTTIEYGALPVAQHTIDELRIGMVWRLGVGDASTWTSAMPLLVGDRLLPPGGYRVQLQRNAENDFQLLVQGTGMAIDGGDDVRIAATLGKTKKPTKKLTLDFAAAGAKVGANQPLQLAVRFGEHELQSELTALGGTAMALSGWQLVVFAVPRAQIERAGRRGVPVATLVPKRASDKAPKGYNLLLAGDEAKLVPWISAPTENGGFGTIAPPDPAFVKRGTVTRTGGDDGGTDGTGTTVAVNPLDQLQLKAASLQKHELELKLAVGTTEFEVRIAEPGTPSK